MRLARKIVASLAVVVATGAVAVAGASAALGGGGGAVATGAPQVESSLSRPLSLAPAASGRVTSIATVANTGSATGRLRLALRTEGDARFARLLRVSVADTAGRTLYRGPVTGLRRLALGSLAAGAERRFRLSLTLLEGGNEVQGARARTDFRWTLVQA